MRLLVFLVGILVGSIMASYFLSKSESEVVIEQTVPIEKIVESEKKVPTKALVFYSDGDVESGEDLLQGDPAQEELTAEEHEKKVLAQYRAEKQAILEGEKKGGTISIKESFNTNQIIEGGKD